MKTFACLGCPPPKGMTSCPASDIRALDSTPLPYLFLQLTSQVEPVSIKDAILRSESRGAPVVPSNHTFQALQKVFPRAAIRTYQARIAACAILRGFLADRRFSDKILAIRAHRDNSRIRSLSFD